MSQLSQAIITPTCQNNRGRIAAWEEAVTRLRAFYEDVTLAWNVGNQPTFTLTLEMQRPPSSSAPTPETE